MRRLIITIGLAFFLGGALPEAAGEVNGQSTSNPEIGGDALAIVKKCYDACRSLTDETEEIEARLYSAHGDNYKTMRFTRRVRYHPEGEDKVFIKMLYPQEDWRRAFLVFRHRDSDDDMYMWMKAINRVRQIPVSSDDYLWGMDLTYMDISMLTGEQWWKYSYTLKEINEKQFVIESRPRPDTLDLRGYGKRMIWIDRETYFPVKYEYYHHDIRLKSQVVEGIYQIDNVWRWKRIEIQNFDEKHSTVLTCSDSGEKPGRIVNSGIADTIFSIKNLDAQQ